MAPTLVAAGVAGAVLVAVGIAALTGGLPALFGGTGAHPPGPGTRFAVLTQSSAAKASTTGTGAARDAATFLATQPTAYWLTPERDPIGTAGPHIRVLASEARAQSATLALVVYGLPGRDCGNHSAGGLATDDYPVWIAEIAASLGASSDVPAVIVLEPDSLALAEQCGNLTDRVAELRPAIAALQRPGSWIYLDGGHSNWHPAAEQARLLRAVGVEGVRGFSLNVSNFNATDAEVAYAHAVAADLGGDAHALIDTSRNGAGSDGQWCNPPGRLVGEPSGTRGDTVVDTNLWVKPPGESDGPCNGAPAAGRWWSAAAEDLTRGARR